MSENKNEIEKVREWAKKDPTLQPYLDNAALLKQFYVKRHIAKSVDECIEGSKAELEVIIARAYEPYPKELCRMHYKKECDQGCGKEDYVLTTFYSFSAGDKTGVVTLRITPWSKIDGSKIQEERQYKVTGTIGKPYNGTYDLAVKTIEPLQEALTA